ncbi:MAG: hypothetical protein GF419_08515 [Ignavibacteriales bacterium]|nr:hypothetical protein [Ignavibacteriales bacterium]
MKSSIPSMALSTLAAVVIWISISLSQEYYTTVEAPLRFVDFPEGYALGAETPQHVKLRIRGDGWKLVGMDFAKDRDFRVSVGKDTGEVVVSLIDAATENQWATNDVDLIDVQPTSVRVRFDEIERIMVPVAPLLDVHFREGFALASPYVVEPESALAVGSGRLIRERGVALTEPFSRDELDEKIVETLPLQEGRGIDYQPDAVTLRLDVQRVVDREFASVPIRVRDVPPDREVMLNPDEVNIVARGGIETLGKLSAEDFDVEIAYRDIVLDTLGSLAPVVKAPDNVRVISISPERISRYAIKQY